MQIEGLPGGDLVLQGLDDLSRGVESAPAFLVSIGAPRLRRIGMKVPETAFPEPEHRLYEMLAKTDPDSAHSRYNALIRRLVSFERAAECVRVADAARIRRLMSALSEETERETRVYFTGGASAVLFGWRATTIDVDLRIVPESDRLLRAMPALKESLELNIELASPADFIPAIHGWEERSRFIETQGRLSFFHYDFYSQALAKIERGHAQDRDDVEEMVRRGLVEPARALEYFEQIEPHLYRYPAIDPASFRRAAERILGPTG